MESTWWIDLCFNSPAGERYLSIGFWECKILLNYLRQRFGWVLPCLIAWCQRKNSTNQRYSASAWDAYCWQVNLKIDQTDTWGIVRFCILIQHSHRNSTAVPYHVKRTSCHDECCHNNRASQCVQISDGAFTLTQVHTQYKDSWYICYPVFSFLESQICSILRCCSTAMHWSSC